MSDWKSIRRNAARELSNMAEDSVDVLVLNAFFSPDSKESKTGPHSCRLTDETTHLLAECVRVLKTGGLLFVYGLPRELPFAGEYLDDHRFESAQMLFKYWIALEIDERPATGFLKPAHLGLLMYLKTGAGAKSVPSFKLNTSEVRVPHSYCVACGQNVKDWGGKKHLMNPRGTALSDVWRDLPKIKIKNHIVPAIVLDRIMALTKQEKTTHLHVIQDAPMFEAETSSVGNLKPQFSEKNGDRLEFNQVFHGDCITFLNRIANDHPEGVFDLTFADPPYNLKKNYDSYADGLAERQYVDWCNDWLDGMVRTLKPGGSLFVLNLPKWAIHHAAFLNQRMDFRHWIVWDALSDPRGKLMPAHYALLYYTKPGGKPVFNYSTAENADSEKVLPPDAPKYCLRAGCVKERKKLGDDEKVPLSDIWFDIHRIKHKRDRDAHPCQLPEKLMERIIRLTTNRGGVVFDPFCGAGTTAIAATKLGRQFVVTDLDPNYVRITKDKLSAMQRQVDLFGEFSIPRQSTQKVRTGVTKREIEIYLQKLATKLGREPAEQEIDSEMLGKIDSIYPTRLAAIKRCRVVLDRVHLKD